MNRVAIISDIHGNLPALETVLEDIHARSVDALYCLGDLAGKGPQGDTVIYLRRETCDGVVKGNWDEMMLRSKVSKGFSGTRRSSVRRV